MSRMSSGTQDSISGGLTQRMAVPFLAEDTWAGNARNYNDSRQADREAEGDAEGRHGGRRRRRKEEVGLR